MPGRQARLKHTAMRNRAKPRARYRRVLRKLIYERDDYLCWICGLAVSLDVSSHDKTAASLDHVIPVSQGGRWTIDNLRTAHRACNDARGTG